MPLSWSGSKRHHMVAGLYSLVQVAYILQILMTRATVSGVSVTGEVGSALIWWNLRSDGSLDSRNCNLIADNSLVILVVVLVRAVVVVVVVFTLS